MVTNDKFNSCTWLHLICGFIITNSVSHDCVCVCVCDFWTRLTSHLSLSLLFYLNLGSDCLSVCLSLLFLHKARGDSLKFFPLPLLSWMTIYVNWLLCHLKDV